MLHEMIDQLDADIAACEERIRANEKWAFREETRVVPLAENYTLESLGYCGIEVKKTTVLVGAEEVRKFLNELLQNLTGLISIKDSKAKDMVEIFFRKCPCVRLRSQPFCGYYVSYELPISR